MTRDKAKKDKVEETDKAVILMKDVLEMDAVLGRYVVRPQRPQPPTKEASEELHAAYNAALSEYTRRMDVVDRVVRFAKFAAGLGRNANLLRAETELYYKTLREPSPKSKAYQEAVQKLNEEKLPPAENARRIAALNKEHDLDGLNVELAARQEELQADPSTIEKWYAMPISYLPGWNDADDATESARRGVIDPIDIAFFLRVGVLIEEPEAKKP